jgi:hypothetical protein
MRIITFIALILFLSGCETLPGVKFKKDDLTGREYCIADIQLTSLKVNEGGLLTIRSAGAPPSNESEIRAVLKLAHHGVREYNLNPDEELSLMIDGDVYALKIMNSSHSPMEEKERGSTYIGSGGGSIVLGSVSEVTRRQIAFFIPRELIVRLASARVARLEINSHNMDSIYRKIKYPILLEFSEINLALAEQFDSQCLRGLGKK